MTRLLPSTITPFLTWLRSYLIWVSIKWCQIDMLYTWCMSPYLLIVFSYNIMLFLGINSACIIKHHYWSVFVNLVPRVINNFFFISVCLFFFDHLLHNIVTGIFIDQPWSHTNFYISMRDLRHFMWFLRSKYLNKLPLLIVPYQFIKDVNLLTGICLLWQCPDFTSLFYFVKSILLSIQLILRIFSWAHLYGPSSNDRR